MAYKNEALSRAQVFRQHKAFLDGGETVKDEARSCKLFTSKIEKNVEKAKTLKDLIVV